MIHASESSILMLHERNEFVFDVFRLLAKAILVIRQDISPEHYLGCVYVGLLPAQNASR